MPRKGRYAPLQMTDKDRWLAIRDNYGTLIEHRHLPPGTDLKAALVCALAAHADDGFVLEDFSSALAFAFIHRGDTRRQIGIEFNDPTKDHGYRHARGF